MLVVIVGIDHELQTPGQSLITSGPLPLAEQSDKARFAQVLAEIAHSRSVAIVAEEQLSPRPTIPRSVALDLKLRHEYVDMPADEREARGIPRDYTIAPGLADAVVQSYHSQREAYWVDRLEACAQPGDSCILVCGWATAAA